MYAGEFLKRLRTLNSALRVCSFGDNSHLAGLYYIDKQGEYSDICGVDKNWVPEYSEWDDKGHIVVSGWRRVYLMLLQLKLTSRDKIRKVCPGFFLHYNQVMVDADRKVRIAGDEIAEKIQKYSEAAPIRRWMDPDTKQIVEGSVLTDDQNLEIAADINNKDTQNVKEQTEKDRWFLTEWASRGGNLSDKPKI